MAESGGSAKRRKQAAEVTQHGLLEQDGAKEAGSSIKVMTFNMRLDTPDDADRGGRDCRWAQRRDLFTAVVLKNMPDILGMQEVMPNQHEDLRDSLAEVGYTLLYQPRSGPGSEGVCMAIRRPWQATSHGAFWLAVDSPDVPGSVAPGAKHSRVALWASLEDGAGRRLLFLNTHLEHTNTEVGEKVRVRSSEQLAQFLAENAKGSPAILVLDANAEPGAQAHSHFVDSGLVDSWAECHPAEAMNRPTTFHLFKGLDFAVSPEWSAQCWLGGLGPSKRKTCHIDWIFHTASLRAEKCEIDRTIGEDGTMPSDHFAVCAILNPANIVDEEAPK